MRSRIYTLSLILLAVLVGLIATQCAQPGGPAEEIAPTVEPVVEIVPSPAPSVLLSYVSYWVYISAQTDVDKELVERFQEAYPHVEVERKSYGMSGENYLTAEVPPDAITWDGSYMYPQTEHRDLFMDISPLWKQEGWEDVIPDNLQALSQSAGRYYHVPTHYFWEAFYYNKAVFEQHDLKEPETWDEFLAVCATLKEAGVTPIAIGFGPDSGWQAVLWFDYLNIRINGLEFRNELMLEGQVPFNDPRVREVFATLQTLLEEGYFTEDNQYLSAGEGYVSVLNGEAAMVLAPQMNLLDLIPETRWDEFDFFPFPVIDPDIPVVQVAGIEGFAIPANAPDPQAAMEFLIYRGSAEAQGYWAEGCGPIGGVPARSDIDAAALTPAVQKAREMIENADELTQFIFRHSLPMSPMVDPMIRHFRFWFDDPGTLDEFLDKLEERRQAVFDE